MKNNTILLRNGTWVVFVFAALFMCLPSILLEYGMHDDYRYLAAPKTDFWSLHPDMSGGAAMGRPIAILFIGLQSLLTNSVSDFVWQRFALFLFILLSALLIYYYFTRRLRMDTFFSLCAVFCIFTLPAGQLFVLWSVWSVFATPALLFTIISYLLLDYAWQNFFLFKRWKSYVLFAFISFGIFLISLYDYPVISLFFLILTCANILFSEFRFWPKTRKRIAHDISFCSLGMLVYFISYKLIYLPLMLKYFPHLSNFIGTSAHAAQHQVGIRKDFSEMLKVFYDASLFSFGGVFHPMFGDRASVIILFTIMGGCSVVFLGYLMRRHALQEPNHMSLPRIVNWTFQIFCAIFVIILLSTAPILIAVKGNSNYRTLFPYSAIIILIIFWLLCKMNFFFIRKRTVVLLFMVFSLGILAQINMLNTSLSANRELNFIRQKLSTVDFSATHSLEIIQPFVTYVDEPVFYDFVRIRYREGPVFGDFYQRLEFDHMATNRTFIWEIVRAVLNEMGIPSNILIYSAQSNPPNPNWFHSNKSSYTIDMNEILTDRPSFKVASITKNTLPIMEIDASKFVSAQILKDSEWYSINFKPDFWEEIGVFPHWFQIRLHDFEILTEYSLATGPYGKDDVGRIPKDWVLQGSHEGEQWVDLDKRSGEAGWQNNEERIYKVAIPASFKFYRFYFNMGNNPKILRISKIKVKFL